MFAGNEVVRQVGIFVGILDGHFQSQVSSSFVWLLLLMDKRITVLVIYIKLSLRSISDLIVYTFPTGALITIDVETL